jgi:hypothetical protein
MQSRYSRSLTQELIDLLYSNGVVRILVIGFNDPQAEGTVNWANHDNHLHARFYFEHQAAGFPTVRIGMHNSPPVREVQRRLNNWMGDGDGLVAIDGDFGQNTYEAVRRFQEDKGLAVDGVFGKDSWQASTAHIV